MNLHGKTRVIATHQLHLLPQFDRIMILEQGRIVHFATFQELMSKETNLLKFVPQQHKKEYSKVSKHQSREAKHQQKVDKIVF